MNISSLPKFPALWRRGPATPTPASNRRAVGILLDLAIVLAIVAVLYELRRTQLAIERPWLERNLEQVYETLSVWHDFDAIDQWCGLRHTSATAAEAEFLSRTVRVAQDLKHFVCGPSGKQMLSEYPRVFRELHLMRHHERFQWVRIHHATDSNQWIGICVMMVYSTGSDKRWIVLRVPVGFRPC